MKKLIQKINWKKVIKFLILIVVLAVGGVFAFRHFVSNKAKSATTTTTVSNEKVQTRSIQNVLSASGTISPIHTYDVKSLVQGKIIKADFEEGDKVKKGQVLYKIDTETIDSQIDSAETKVTRAENDYTKAKENYQDALSSYSEAKSDYAAAKKKYSSSSSSTSISSTSSINSNGAQASTTQDTAETQLENYKKAVETAKSSVENAQNSVETAKEAIEDAKSNLEQVEESKADYIITAPISGTIVSKSALAGDTVSTNNSTALCTIYDLSAVKFSMDIDELDIKEVKVGQKVSVTADALDGVEITGKVTNISLESNASSGVTNYPVTVKISDVGDLLPGMNVTGDIIVEEADNVLAIPSDALMRNNVVYVKDSSVKKANGDVPAGYKSVQVTTGITDGNYIEIKSGLSGNETVYVKRVKSSSSLDSSLLKGFNIGGQGMPSGNGGGMSMPSGNGGGMSMPGGSSSGQKGGN